MLCGERRVTDEDRLCSPRVVRIPTKHNFVQKVGAGRKQLPMTRGVCGDEEGRKNWKERQKPTIERSITRTMSAVVRADPT